MNFEDKVEAALTAVRAVFHDMSVSASTVRGALEDLRDELEPMIGSLPEGDE